MGRKWSDNFVTNLAGSLVPATTTLSVTSGTGTYAPAVTGKGAAGSAIEYLVITLEDSAGNIEKIKCEAHAAGSDTFGSGPYPLIRGYDGTTAGTWTAGTSMMVEIRVDKSFLQDASDRLLAADPAVEFGRKDFSTSGLNFAYYGGQVWVDGVLTTIADGSIALTASQTNYVERSAAGAVSSNTTGFTAGRIPMYEIATNTTDITSIQERRTNSPPQYGRATHALTGGEIAAFTANASAAEARCGIIEVTGALAGNTTFILPQVNGVFVVKNGTSGAFSLTFKASSGAGIAVTQGKTQVLYWDGTNYVKALADAEPVDPTIARTGQVNTFTKAQIGAVVALTDAATVALDLSLSNNFSLTIGGNRTLGNPTNAVPGQSGTIAVTQDGTGSRTLGYAGNYKFASGSAPVLSTGAAAVDLLAYYVISPTQIYISAAKDIR